MLFIYLFIFPENKKDKNTTAKLLLVLVNKYVLALSKKKQSQQMHELKLLEPILMFLFANADTEASSNVILYHFQNKIPSSMNKITLIYLSQLMQLEHLLYGLIFQSTTTVIINWVPDIILSLEEIKISKAVQHYRTLIIFLMQHIQSPICNANLYSKIVNFIKILFYQISKCITSTEACKHEGVGLLNVLYIVDYMVQVMIQTKTVHACKVNKLSTHIDTQMTEWLFSLFKITLESLNVHLNNVTSVKFVNWHEISAKDPTMLNPKYSLQNRVSHLAQKILDCNQEQNFQHNALKKLGCIACTREQPQQELKYLSLESLKNSVAANQTNNELLKILFPELLSRTETYNTQNNISFIHSMKNLLSPSDIILIFNTIESTISSVESNKLFVEMYSSVLDKMNNKSIINFIEKMIKIKNKTYEHILIQSDLKSVLLRYDFDLHLTLKEIAKMPYNLFFLLPKILLNELKLKKTPLKKLVDKLIILFETMLPIKKTLKPYVKKFCLEIQKHLSNESSISLTASFITRLCVVQFFEIHEVMEELVIENLLMEPAKAQTIYAIQILNKLSKWNGFTQYITPALIVLTLTHIQIRKNFSAYCNHAAFVKEGLHATHTKLIKCFETSHKEIGKS